MVMVRLDGGPLDGQTLELEVESPWDVPKQLHFGLPDEPLCLYERMWPAITSVWGPGDPRRYSVMAGLVWYELVDRPRIYGTA
jgi:hypothetical protein